MDKKLRFKEFVGSGTLTIFDIDETLFHTKAMIKVMKDGKKVRELDNQQFNTYKLKAGEDFDFGEFRSAKIFRETSTPVVRMIEKAKAIFRNIRNPQSRIIICTARADFDDKDMFLQTFRDHGLPVDSMYVERAGNFGLGSSAENKKVVFRKYLNTKNYTKTRLFDDAMSNLRAFLDLQSEYPGVKFEAFFVEHDGSIKRVK